MYVVHIICEIQENVTIVSPSSVLLAELYGTVYVHVHTVYQEVCEDIVHHGAYNEVDDRCTYVHMLMHDITCDSLSAVRGGTCTIHNIIVSITKFLILISSPRHYLSCYWRTITRVSNYTCPISTFCNWIPVIGHLCHLPVIYVHYNRFFNLFLFLYCLQNVCNIPQTFSIKKDVSKTS